MQNRLLARRLLSHSATAPLARRWGAKADPLYDHAPETIYAIALSSGGGDAPIYANALSADQVTLGPPGGGEFYAMSNGERYVVKGEFRMVGMEQLLMLAANRLQPPKPTMS